MKQIEIKTIEDVMEQYPNLNNLGFYVKQGYELNNPRIINNIELAREYIRKYYVKRKTINKRYWSYSLKHRLEEFTEDNTGNMIPINNGSAIAAFLLEGYTLYRDKYEGGPNCYFNARMTKEGFQLRKNRYHADHDWYKYRAWM